MQELSFTGEKHERIEISVHGYERVFCVLLTIGFPSTLILALAPSPADSKLPFSQRTSCGREFQVNWADLEEHLVVGRNTAACLWR